MDTNTTIAESFPVATMHTRNSRLVTPVVCRQNRQPVPDDVQSLIQYFIRCLSLDSNLDISGVQLCESKPVETAHSHKPGILVRHCVGPNALEVIVKTLDSRCFLCQILAFDSNGREIVNSKLLSSICESLSGKREFYVTETEIKEFRLMGTLSPNQARLDGERKNGPNGLLSLREVLAHVDVPAESSVSTEAPPDSPPKGEREKNPTDFEEVVRARYHFDDLVKGLRARSEDGKKEFSIGEVTTATKEILGLPLESRDRMQSIRFIQALMRFRILKRLGKGVPAKYRITGFRYDPGRDIALLRQSGTDSSAKTVSTLTEGGAAGTSGVVGRITDLENMAIQFRSARSEIDAVHLELEQVEKMLSEHDQNKARMDEIEAEIKKLRTELNSFSSKTNIRGVKSHRDALLRHRTKLEAILASPSYQTAESKLAQLEALMVS